MGAIWPRCQVRGLAARGRGSGSPASLQRCPRPTPTPPVPPDLVLTAAQLGSPPARRDPLKGEDLSDEETHRKFDKDFREGAVRLAREIGKPIAQWPGTWVSRRAPWATIDAYACGLAEYLETRERDGTDPLTATRAHVAGFVRELRTRPSRRGRNVMAFDSGGCRTPRCSSGWYRSGCLRLPRRGERP
jgi:hypothetical protein